MTNKRFTVVDHNYLNTGGNMMVSIFAVYDRTAKSMRYMIANDEGFNWQTADTVTNDELHELMDTDKRFADAVVLGNYIWEHLTSEPAPLDPCFSEDEFELFKYCQFEFYKRYCADFDIKMSVAAHQLPNNLYEQLTDECIKWHDDNCENFMTDGHSVYTSLAYIDYCNEQSDRELQDIKRFKEHFDTLCSAENIDRLYGSYITICIDGDSVKVPFGAIAYNHLDDLLEEVIEEW